MLKIGAASKIITGETGAWIQGAGVFKRAEQIRDELEANALYIENNGEKLLLASCDLVAVPSNIVAAARAQISRTAAIPERSIIIAGTHTHSAPSVVRTSYRKPVDDAYLERLTIWLTELAKAAVACARPGKIGWGRGAARIGYNRRCCWDDGTHTMHWNPPGRSGFIGLEGPDDTDHTVIAAVDADDKLIAILQNNTTHPTCFYGADFFSADCPGASREFLRKTCGNIPVLFFNGAFGDISIDCQAVAKPFGESREQMMLRAAHLMTGETLRLLHEMAFHADMEIRHKFEDMIVPVRLPEEEKLAWAKNIIKKIDAGENIASLDQIFAWGTVDLDNNFGKSPSDIVPIHVIMIGELAIVTQPCELFCRFGLDIKRRSPFAATVIFGIADGYNGYCPTIEAIMGGGYSGEPISWTRLSEQAGYRIVDTASRLLREIRE